MHLCIGGRDLRYALGAFKKIIRGDVLVVDMVRCVV